jgi:hypothetical protein
MQDVRPKYEGITWLPHILANSCIPFASFQFLFYQQFTRVTYREISARASHRRVIIPFVILCREPTFRWASGVKVASQLSLLPVLTDSPYLCNVANKCTLFKLML